MKVVEFYSHYNGLEFLLVHKKTLWEEVKEVISKVNAENCKIRNAIKGRIQYSIKEFNKSFGKLLKSNNWEEIGINVGKISDEKLIRKTLSLDPEEQKRKIEAAGSQPIFSYNQTDFVKDRVAIEIQFGKYSFVAYDLFVKHLAFYIGDKIDVGIEILPMKSLQSRMSSGIAYYEGELYNVIRQGRGVPAVPLVLIGIDV